MLTEITYRRSQTLCRVIPPVHVRVGIVQAQSLLRAEQRTGADGQNASVLAAAHRWRSVSETQRFLTVYTYPCTVNT
jgi:hypothetical protein